MTGPTSTGQPPATEPTPTLSHLTALAAGTTLTAVPAGTIHGRPITRRRQYTVDRAPWVADRARRTVVLCDPGSGPVVVHADSIRVQDSATGTSA